MRFFGHQGRVFDIALDPMEASIATAGADQTVRFWDLSDAEPRYVFEFSKTSRQSVSTNGVIGRGLYEMGKAFYVKWVEAHEQNEN